jgi:hypothetical protein
VLDLFEVATIGHYQTAPNLFVYILKGRDAPKRNITVLRETQAYQLDREIEPTDDEISM